jgi:hypothetical protein
VTLGCDHLGGPETLSEANRYDQWLQSRDMTPFRHIDSSAYATALAQRRALAALPAGTNNNAAWQPVGGPALMASDTTYGPNVDGWGNLAGRTTAFAHDPATAGRYFESFNNGGVWESRDSGAHWVSIGDGLPTQVIGAIAWSPASGGTLFAGSGDNATGRYSTDGVGIYYTSDDGASWSTSSGIPVGILSFRIVIDPSNSSNVYAATNKGLWRSTDGGASFSNVNLPLPTVTPSTGPAYNCTWNQAGATDYRCFFANMVTDVVVRSPDAGGVGGGKVLAVLGWKYGPQGFRNENTGVLDASMPQAPRNGIYVSSNGTAGSFAFVDPGNTAPSTNGFTPTPLVGRVALGIAHGATQNHDLVYALVQDANKLANACVDILDTTVTCNPPAPQGINTLGNTFLDGIYVSSNFGSTWTRLSDGVALQAPGSNSALSRGSVLGNDGVGPGYQAWYNEWIEPDPTQSDPVSHAPTRLLFGLEEVWENQTSGAPVPQDGSVAPETFKVIGRYWDSCTGLSADPLGQPCTGTPPAGTTTHPDQHAAMVVPDASGNGETLVAGNDGGAFVQHIDNLTQPDFSQQQWGSASGNNSGAHTLLPYALDVTNNGTVLAGLQDNGAMMIRPDGSEQMVYGGDGFFTAIDPNNPNNQLEEYVGGRVSVSVDGGHTYRNKDPNNAQSGFVGTAQFSTPEQRDPNPTGDTNMTAHAMIGSQYIMETTSAYTNSCSNSSDPLCSLVSTANDLAHWITDFNLGTDGAAFRSSTAIDLSGANAYAGWCSSCYTNTGAPFNSGVATNVGGSGAPTVGSGSGWHIATAAGLPKRIITSLRMDPTNPNTVYATLGTYLPRYIPADALGPHPNAGSGHVFKSTDHGESFTDITGNLPNAPANWSLIHNGQLVVATNVGVFVSADTNGGTYTLLGSGLPVVPVFQMELQPGSPDVLYAATFGRGVYKYDFNGTIIGTPEVPLVAGLALVGIAAATATAWRRRRRTAD